MNQGYCKEVRVIFEYGIFFDNTKLTLLNAERNVENFDFPLK